MEKLFKIRVIIVLILTFIGISQLGFNAKLIEINFDNHNSLLINSDYSFLLFYTNWCHHCKIISNEILQVSSYYQSQKNNSILFGKINGVFEKDLLEKYDIGEYPTIKFLINQTAYDYTGGRTASEIIEWIEIKTKNTTIEIADLAQLNQLIDNNELIILYLGKNNYKFITFSHLSRILDGEIFRHSFDEGLREKFLKNKEWSGVIIFRKSTNTTEFFEGDFSSTSKLQEFINENKLSLISNFSSKLAEKVFGESNKCLFLFLNDNNKSQVAFEALKHASTHLKNKILISVVRNSNKLNENLSGFLGVNQSQLPIVLIKYSSCYKSLLFLDKTSKSQ